MLSIRDGSAWRCLQEPNGSKVHDSDDVARPSLQRAFRIPVARAKILDNYENVLIRCYQNFNAAAKISRSPLLFFTLASALWEAAVHIRRAHHALRPVPSAPWVLVRPRLHCHPILRLRRPTTEYTRPRWSRVTENPIRYWTFTAQNEIECGQCLNALYAVAILYERAVMVFCQSTRM